MVNDARRIPHGLVESSFLREAESAEWLQDTADGAAGTDRIHRAEKVTFEAGGHSATVSVVFRDGFRLRLCEPVTDVAVRQQIYGFSRVVFDLLAYLADEGPKILQFAPVFRTPHCMQQARVHHRHAGMSHEVVQQVELFGREVNRVAGLANQPARRIQIYVSDADYGVRIDLGSTGSPNCGPDSRCQLADVEWLGDVIVTPRIKNHNLVFLTLAH